MTKASANSFAAELALIRADPVAHLRQTSFLALTLTILSDRADSYTLIIEERQSSVKGNATFDLP